MISLEKPILDELVPHLALREIASLCDIANSSQGEPTSEEDAAEKANALSYQRRLIGDQLSAEAMVNLILHENKLEREPNHQNMPALTPQSIESMKRSYRAGGRFNNLLLSLTNTDEDRPHPLPRDFSIDDMIAFLHVATIEEIVQISPEKFDAAIVRIIGQHIPLQQFAENHQTDQARNQFKTRLKIQENMRVAICCHYLSVTVLRHSTLLPSSQHRNLLTAIARISLLELKSAPLIRTNFSQVNFSQLNNTLERYRFIDKDFCGAVMRNLKIKHTTFTRSNLNNADLTGAEMTCISMTDCDLTDTVLIGTTLIDSLLINVDLSSHDLQGITFSGNTVIKDVKILGIPSAATPNQPLMNELLDRFQARAETSNSVEIFRRIAVNELAYWIANHHELDSATKLDLLQQAKQHPVFTPAANQSLFGKLFKPKPSISQTVLGNAIEHVSRSTNERKHTIAQ